ncbi:MAG: hypothetical protein U5O39_05610 [Gammaproteobacteria bacterium]|nr:hypothetical protein [Gammaproteobacteria bacterium]
MAARRADTDEFAKVLYQNPSDMELSDEDRQYLESEYKPHPVLGHRMKEAAVWVMQQHFGKNFLKCARSLARLSSDGRS